MLADQLDYVIGVDPHRDLHAQVAAVMAHYILLRNPALAAYEQELPSPSATRSAQSTASVDPSSLATHDAPQEKAPVARWAEFRCAAMRVP